MSVSPTTGSAPDLFDPAEQPHNGLIDFQNEAWLSLVPGRTVEQLAWEWRRDQTPRRCPPDARPTRLFPA